MNNISSLMQRNRSGEPVGLPCFCTANTQVIEAILKYAKEKDVPAVIEATCNQVNQEGGYTGMRAAGFSQWINKLAAQYGVSTDNLILGGDHLGPNPWRHLPVDRAMSKAQELVKEYAAAGFRKLHLDASMACGGEPTPSFEAVAERAALLCKVAEQHSPHPEELFYIIGTEVPIPGGETESMDDLAVTSVDAFKKTLDTHRQAFDRQGLNDAWPRITSVVTQPGVDFSHTAVHRFEADKVADLSAAVLDVDNITYEAHSTDYQPDAALAELVADHFFFLKVGPELTFRMREAVCALARIEEHLVPVSERSAIIKTIESAMDANPAHWTPYYRGDTEVVNQLRHFSYSDRIRYYWSVDSVKKSLDQLLGNSLLQQIPETIVSQYFPARQFGSLSATAEQLVSDHIALCVDRYYRACGYC